MRIDQRRIILEKGAAAYMQPYTGFAAVYDMFMDNVPYGEWAAYVQKLLNKYGINQGLVLELGCGTGSMTRQLADKGYDMIGIDNSEEMLQIARDKGKEGGDGILYLCQDMREFELYGTVAAVVSVCDSMNYILSEEELLQVFKLVNNYLDPNGIFIFDLDTQYAYEEVLGDTTIAENREEGSFIWENTYYEDEMMNEINLTLFLPEQELSLPEQELSLPEQELSLPEQELSLPEQGGEAKEDSQGTHRPTLFHRYEETHYRRAYKLQTVKDLIEEAGMEWVAVYEALTEKKPKKDSERVYIIAREKRQENKLYTEG